jgi:pimeloyl-ACP methyl ester carboxylesterase
VSAHTRRRPVFLVASEKDGYSADTVRTLADEALGQAELHVYAGGAHGTQISFTQSELLGELVHFLEGNLAPRG